MKDNYFLYVGNAYPHKNVEVLVAAAKLAGVRVVYVGKNDYFYKRLGIVPQSVSDAELETLYKNAQALVFPSLMEGFGLPALEALRNNCPVILSDIPVFYELFGDVPAYFPPHDVEALAHLLKNPPPKPKNIEKLLAKFSWPKMAKKTLDTYNDAYGRT